MKTTKFAFALAALTALSIASASLSQGRPDQGADARPDLELTIQESEIKSFMMKAQADAQPAGRAASRGSGGGAGKASFSDLSFVRTHDKASPMLAKMCATGKHIPKAVLFVRKAGKGQEDYYKVTMSDVLVSSYQFSPGSGGDRPTESVSFNYAKIEFEYKPQKDR